jgi:hypothetical protein
VEESYTHFHVNHHEGRHYSRPIGEDAIVWQQQELRDISLWSALQQERMSRDI